MEATEKTAPPARRRIYLVRHGEVSYFDAQGRPYRPRTVPLNAEGRVQAEAAARELARIPIDRVVSSDLPRCVETASILASGRGGLHLETHTELREIQPGRLSSLPVDAVQHSFLGAFSSGFNRETRFLGGETFGSLVDRVLGCFQKLIAEPSWRHLLIVAHGGVNRVLLSHVLGGDLHAFATLEQDAGCINVIDVDGADKFLVRLVNYTPYNTLKAGLETTTMERLYQQYRPQGTTAIPPR